MILGLHRQTLVGLIGRGTLGNRPRQEHAGQLEAEVPVEVASSMFLDDEDAPPRHHTTSERLRRAGGGPLVPILREAVVAGRGHGGGYGMRLPPKGR